MALWLFLRNGQAVFSQTADWPVGGAFYRIRFNPQTYPATEQGSHSAYVTNVMYLDKKWTSFVRQKTQGWTWSYLAKPKSCFVIQAPDQIDLMTESQWTDLRVSSLQFGLFTKTHSSFTPESCSLFPLSSSVLRWEGLDFRAEAREAQLISDKLQ